jgi:hypothetical protein
MKKFSISIIVLFSAAQLLAQMPQGGGYGGRGGGGFGGGRRGGPPQGRGNFNPDKIDETLTLETFPDIPDLTLEQRRKTGEVMTDEQKAIRKLDRQKHELHHRQMQAVDWDEKKIEKNREKIEKTDEKIAKRIEESNKKVKKILSEEQYEVFIEKRNDFKFNIQAPPIPRFRDGDTESGFPQGPPDRQTP